MKYLYMSAFILVPMVAFAQEAPSADADAYKYQYGQCESNRHNEIVGELTLNKKLTDATAQVEDLKKQITDLTKQVADLKAGKKTDEVPKKDK